MRKIGRICGLISELLGNISKWWEHFTNLLSCREFFPWKAEIIPQKRKFVHFFHLNYEIYLSFLINWIFLRPNSRNYFQFYLGNISDYIFGKIYGQDYPTISYTLRVILVYPIFIASHDMIKKTFLFCNWSSCSRVKRRRSTSLGFNSYGTQFPSFWIIPNAFKRFETVVWSTPNNSASSASVWHEFSLGNAFNSSSSNYRVSQLYVSFWFIRNTRVFCGKSLNSYFIQ